MKKAGKRWISGILVFALLCTLFVVMPGEQTFAAGKKKPAFEQTKRTLFLGNESSYTEILSFTNVSTKAKVTNIKFSDPAVLKQGDLYQNNQGIYCRTLKTGKCTVSCKVKQGGKTYKLSMTVTVKKANPFSYVKIDGKNVYQGGTSKLCGHYTTSKSSVKVSYKLKSGWKLKKMYSNYHYKDASTGMYTMTKDKTVKNGGKVSLKKEYTSVKIDVQNSKGEVYCYLITLYKTSAKSASLKKAGMGKAEPEICITELGQVYE